MPIIQQSTIPTLTSLYASAKLSASSSTAPLRKASASLNSRVGLIRADITTLQLPNGAIVNAANSRLLGGGGVDGAIHRAAGPDLVKECQTLGGAGTGEAKITDAYRLPCKKVIHAVGPVFGTRGEDSAALLASCYKTSLELAVENKLSAIAFSAISTGVYGYPSAPAADVAIKTVRDFLESEKGNSLKLVVFCNFEMKDVNAYNGILPAYFPEPKEGEKDDFELPKESKTEGSKIDE